jgi:hypothetical protein
MGQEVEETNWTQGGEETNGTRGVKRQKGPEEKDEKKRQMGHHGMRQERHRDAMGGDEKKKDI